MHQRFDDNNLLCCWSTRAFLGSVQAADRISACLVWLLALRFQFVLGCCLGVSRFFQVFSFSVVVCLELEVAGAFFPCAMGPKPDKPWIPEAEFQRLKRQRVEFGQASQTRSSTARSRNRPDKNARARWAAGDSAPQDYEGGEAVNSSLSPRPFPKTPPPPPPKPIRGVANPKRLRDSGSGEDDPWHWRNPVPRELVHSPFGEEVASPKAAAVEGRSERCVASSSGCLASRGRDVSVSLKQGGEVSLPQLPEKQAVS